MQLKIIKSYHIEPCNDNTLIILWQITFFLNNTIYTTMNFITDILAK